MMSELQNFVANLFGVSPDIATFIICVPAFILALMLLKK
jgi:hypothetical protein